jgi:hypothetical protein
MNSGLGTHANGDTESLLMQAPGMAGGARRDRI